MPPLISSVERSRDMLMSGNKGVIKKLMDIQNLAKD